EHLCANIRGEPTAARHSRATVPNGSRPDPDRRSAQSPRATRAGSLPTGVTDEDRPPSTANSHRHPEDGGIHRAEELRQPGPVPARTLRGRESDPVERPIQVSEWNNSAALPSWDHLS